MASFFTGEGAAAPLRGYGRGVLSEAKSRAALRICKADSNAPKNRRTHTPLPPLRGFTPQRPACASIGSFVFFRQLLTLNVALINLEVLFF